MKVKSPMRAIRAKCLECTGANSTKEVSLCHILDCTLWPHRTGRLFMGEVYKRRMSLAKKTYTKEIEELQKMGVDLDLMFKGIK